MPDTENIIPKQNYRALLNRPCSLLIPNALCDHNLVVNNSLWPLWLVSTTLVHVLVGYVSPCGYFWFNTFSYFLNKSNMRVCYQLIYSGTGLWMLGWHLSPQQFWGSMSYTSFLLIPMCKWFPIDPQTCTTNIAYPNIHYWNFWLDMCWRV